MSEYTVVPLSDVRPGDVAVCNGREFPVILFCVEPNVDSWAVVIEGKRYPEQFRLFESLGFEFRRPVPREPRTFRRWVALNRDRCLSGIFDDEKRVSEHAEDIQGTYFLADITEVMEP